MWSVMLPLDTLRTNVQVNKFSKDAGIYDVYATVLRKQWSKGIGSFYAGLGPIISRSLLTTVPAMAAYEMTRDSVAQYKSGTNVKLSEC